MWRSTATTAPESLPRRRPPAARLCGLSAVLIGVLGLGVPWGWEHHLRFGLAALPATDVSTLVLDRSGQLLRVFMTREGRWRLPASPQGVDRRFLDLLIACEDRRFFTHEGVDAVAVFRAAVQTVTHGRIVSGGSTLTMQVARLLEPRRARALGPKVRQMVRATALDRELGKAGVLSLYLRACALRRQPAGRPCREPGLFRARTGAPDPGRGGAAGRAAAKPRAATARIASPPPQGRRGTASSTGHSSGGWRARTRSRTRKPSRFRTPEIPSRIWPRMPPRPPVPTRRIRVSSI